MPTTHTMQDEASIRQLIKDLEAGWNKGDAVAFSRIFAEDCEFRSVWGDKAYDRDTVCHAHEELFEGRLRGSRIETEIASLRFVRPDVAFVEVISRMQPHPGNPFQQTIAAVVMVKENGEWRAATFNNAGIPTFSPTP